MQTAIHFTGSTAACRQVELITEASRLGLFESGQLIEWVEAADLLRLRGERGQVRFAHKRREGWRLIVDDPTDAAINTLRVKTSTGGKRVARRGLAAAGLCTIMTAALVGTILFRPIYFARALPLAMERDLGDKIAPLTGLAICTDPAALAAMNAILDRVDPQARQDGFTVELVASPAVNAFALPGGRILVSTGLLDKAADSEAIAGALSHEIAHVRRRHIAAQMVRQLGVAGVVQMVGGGQLADGASNLLSRKFTRDDEAQADGDAVNMLARANISPRTTADLFRDLSDPGGGIGDWLADHPNIDSRESKFRASFRKEYRYTPALGPEQEDALFTGCAGEQYY